jgi:hypothetical protein
LRWRRDGGSSDSAEPNCRKRVQEIYALLESELKQIEAEGQERFWKPLTPPFKSLAPIVDAGTKLCQ